MAIETALQKISQDAQVEGWVFPAKFVPCARTTKSPSTNFSSACRVTGSACSSSTASPSLEVIHDWCRNIDLGRNLPLLAVSDGRIVGDTHSLHQQLGGWKRHIGRISTLVHPQDAAGAASPARSSAKSSELARHVGLERVEAEFIGRQDAARKMFALLGFSNLLLLENYVKDMQAISHDYVLMGLDLKTDEEYAGMG